MGWPHSEGGGLEVDRGVGRAAVNYAIDRFERSLSSCALHILIVCLGEIDVLIVWGSRVRGGYLGGSRRAQDQSNHGRSARTILLA